MFGVPTGTEDEFNDFFSGFTRTNKVEYFNYENKFFYQCVARGGGKDATGFTNHGLPPPSLVKAWARAGPILVYPTCKTGAEADRFGVDVIEDLTFDEDVDIKPEKETNEEELDKNNEDYALFN
jgi:hypothetical protein